MSIQEGDIASRMATRVPEQWRAWGGGNGGKNSKLDTLILKLQLRMSVSHGYDCMWHWKTVHTVQKKSNESVEQTAPSSATQFVRQPRAGAALDIPSDPLFDFDIDNFNMFTSMDWNLGDWAQFPPSS